MRAARLVANRTRLTVGVTLLSLNPSSAMAIQATSDAPLDATSQRLVASARSSFMLQDYLKVSPDSRHVAFAVQRGAKTAIVLDGHVGASFDSVASDLQFSTDSE